MANFSRGDIVHIVPAGLTGKIVKQIETESEKFKKMAQEYKNEYRVDYSEGRDLSEPQYIVSIQGENRKELVSEDELMLKKKGAVTDGLVF